MTAVRTTKHGKRRPARRGGSRAAAKWIVLAVVGLAAVGILMLLVLGTSGATAAAPKPSAAPAGPAPAIPQVEGNFRLPLAPLRPSAAASPAATTPAPPVPERLTTDVHFSPASIYGEEPEAPTPTPAPAESARKPPAKKPAPPKG
jgi:hypothetical protein